MRTLYTFYDREFELKFDEEKGCLFTDKETGEILPLAYEFGDYENAMSAGKWDGIRLIYALEILFKKTKYTMDEIIEKADNCKDYTWDDYYMELVDAKADLIKAKKEGRDLTELLEKRIAEFFEWAEHDSLFLEIVRDFIRKFEPEDDDDDIDPVIRVIKSNYIDADYLRRLAEQS